MPNTIQHKRSSTPGAVPSAAQLAAGELAINTADGIVYLKKSDGAVIPIPASAASASSYETVSKNLAGYPYTLNYTGGVLASVVYALGGGQTITKTLNYTAGALTAVVLSGATPGGISLTKTLSYTAGALSGVSYS